MIGMKERLELELGKRKPGDVQELILDNSKPGPNGEFEGLTDAFENLESLWLMGCGISTLKNFPKLPKLRKIDLSDNRLTGGLEPLVEACPGITHLHLAGNKIKEIDALKPLANMKALMQLDLYNCEVTEQENYREKVFETLPELIFLDGYDRNNEEAPDDEEDLYDEEGDEGDDDDVGDLGEGDDEEDEEFDGDEQEDGDDYVEEVDDEDDEEEVPRAGAGQKRKRSVDEDDEGDDADEGDD